MNVVKLHGLQDLLSTLVQFEQEKAETDDIKRQPAVANETAEVT